MLAFNQSSMQTRGYSLIQQPSEILKGWFFYFRETWVGSVGLNNSQGYIARPENATACLLTLALCKDFTQYFFLIMKVF